LRQGRDRQGGRSVEVTLNKVAVIDPVAATFVRSVDRLLTEQDFEHWLSGKAGLELLKPSADDVLQKWAVSKRVNSSRAPDEDATLIDRVSL